MASRERMWMYVVAVVVAVHCGLASAHWLAVEVFLSLCTAALLVNNVGVNEWNCVVASYAVGCVDCRVCRSAASIEVSQSCEGGGGESEEGMGWDAPVS